jgi:vacuolar-type H+-ATPase subunit F/Vma7
MSVPLFIGDEVSAQGYRLAGLRTLVPAEGEVLAVLERACDQASLVLLDTALAQHIPDATLDALLSRTTPPVVVVPAVRGAARMPDIVSRLRRQLGVLE